MIQIFRFFVFIVIVSFFVLIFCFFDLEKCGVEEVVFVLVNVNKNIVLFGYISIDQILNKMDYKSILMINVIVGVEYDFWVKGLDFIKLVYYVVEVFFDVKGNFFGVYGIFDVKDVKVLKDKFSSVGYVFEKNGEIDWYQMDELSFGIWNNIVVIVMK